MEILRMVYPYTLYAIYALSGCVFILMIGLLLKSFGALKALKLTLAPVDSIQQRITTITTTVDDLSKDFKKKNDNFKEFTKKLGIFLAVVHIFFPKKKKKH